jgi:hypothetical protein
MRTASGITVPAELSHLGDAIGAEALLLLVEQHGGIRLYIPKDINQGSSLARSVGLPAARALSRMFGGEWIKVPIARAWRVRVYRQRGETYQSIARRLLITEGQVGKLLCNAGMTKPTRKLRGNRSRAKQEK